MRCRYSLGSYHRIIWNQVTTLVRSLVLVPPLNGDRMIQDWILQKGNIVIPMTKITTRSVYMLLLPAPVVSRTCKCFMVPTQNTVLVEKQTYKLMELWSPT